MRARWWLLLLVLVAVPSVASTYVPVSDEALAEKARLIAEVTVTSIAPYPTAGPQGLPATGYQMRLERSIQGSAPPGPLTVRVPGGVRADGTLAVLVGAPRFVVGDRLLLFLTPRADGAWDLLHLALGAFRVFDLASGASVVVRNLAGAAVIPSQKASAEERPRDHDRFVAWLQARAARRPAAPAGVAAADYFLDPKSGDLQAIHEKFTLYYDNGGYNYRWKEFVQGLSVPFFAQQAGQPGLAGGGFTEFQAALAAWNDNPGTTVRFSYAGTTATPGSLNSDNGINEITFDDPASELTPYDCKNGGVLAYSYFYVGFTEPNLPGMHFLPIVGSHIVTNKNISCFLSAQPSLASALAESLFTHELGHSLGLAHSCGDTDSPPCADDPALDDAIMRADIHVDGRGARLGSDDQAALQVLYATNPVAPEPCKTDAQTLCLGGRFTVSVDWMNPFDGTRGKGKAIPSSTATGFFTFGDPANIELLVKALNFGDVVKIFYGELTDLQFTLVVRDTLLHADHQYTNTPGNCGGIDPQAFPGRSKRAARGACRPNRNTLCLLGDRFAVTVDWANPGNSTAGHGFTTGGSGISGTFYFTDPGNVELVTKMIDFGDHISFFYGALSDLPYTIHVRDTTSGVEQVYQSTAGRLCGGLDNHAF